VPRSLARPLLLNLALAGGCVQSTGRGPDVGDCANYPEGSYTWGEIGIGTCLAGPTDLTFLERDGKTWLVVSNADPYLNFASGSILLVDIASINLAQRENSLGSLAAHALPELRFPGSLGLLEERGLLLVPDRYSPNATNSVANDRVYVVDVTNPESPTLFDEGSWLRVADDPQLVAVDSSTDRAFVVNLTDHSVAVIDTATTPLALVDAATDARVTPAVFSDSTLWGNPASGSAAEVDGTTVSDPARVVSDRWTLTWVEGTFRVWAPTTTGLDRYVTGLDGAYTADAIGDVTAAGLGSDAVRTPFIGLTGGAVTLYYADSGGISSVFWNDSTRRWDRDLARRVLTTTDTHPWLGAPSVIPVEGEIQLYAEARDAADQPPRIVVARGTDGVNFGEAEMVLEAPEGFLGVGSPFLRADPLTGSLRMWVSLWDGAFWSIGHTESFDSGATWAPVTEVLRAPDTHLASPVITWSNGRYLLWATEGDGTAWSHVSAWSTDGESWSEPDFAFASDASFDGWQPPRVALQADPTAGWRVTGENIGWLNTLATTGTTYAGTAAQGFSFRVNSGFEVGTSALGEAGSSGIEPGSLADIGGIPTLYATAYDADGRPQIVALQQGAQAWLPVAFDLVPDAIGGNAAGVRDPVVVETEGEYLLFYAATDSEGITRIRRARSTNGLDFVPEGGDLVPAGDWDALAQRPRSVEILDDGSLRLWYSGDDGARSRIGSAIDFGEGVTLEPGATDPWQIGLGGPGDFDDSGVKDPAVARIDGVQHLWYAGFDGSVWKIGHATRTDDASPWIRSVDAVNERARPVLFGLDRSFSLGGVYSPMVGGVADGVVDLWYAGSDGLEPRIGRAVASSDRAFPTPRFPTAGDELRFSSVAGTEGTSFIDLAQYVDGFNLDGTGSAAAVLDAEAGFLYVPSKRTNLITVLDVRDDSSGDFVDANAYDIEAVLPVRTQNGPRGFRDVEVIPGTHQLYVTSWNPDGVFVLDTSAIVDDDLKQAYPLTPVAALPLAFGTEDEGEPSQTGLRPSDDQLTGGDMALAGNLLLVPHFQDNSLSVIDTTLGAYGQEIRRIPNIGENPHLVRVSPDGRFAFVANYAGGVDENRVSSTIAVVDLDPTHDTYLEVLTWLTNR
jgi:DNA-binding beta-propeller fold protein YncE